MSELRDEFGNPMYRTTDEYGNIVYVDEYGTLLPQQPYSGAYEQEGYTTSTQQQPMRPPEPEVHEQPYSTPSTGVVSAANEAAVPGEGPASGKPQQPMEPLPPEQPQQQRPGSSSSSSTSEEVEEHGVLRKKKSLKEKIMGKLPGMGGKEKTKAHDYSEEEQRNLPKEKKSVLKKIKEKLPGHGHH